MQGTAISPAAGLLRVILESDLAFIGNLLSTQTLLGLGAMCIVFASIQKILLSKE